MPNPVGVAIVGCGGVLDGKQPLTHGEDARKSLELVVAAYESIKSGRAVRLPLVSAGAVR